MRNLRSYSRGARVLLWTRETCYFPKKLKCLFSNYISQQVFEQTSQIFSLIVKPNPRVLWLQHYLVLIIGDNPELQTNHRHAHYRDSEYSTIQSNPEAENSGTARNCLQIPTQVSNANGQTSFYRSNVARPCAAAAFSFASGRLLEFQGPETGISCLTTDNAILLVKSADSGI